jgi:hypothetical protein
MGDELHPVTDAQDGHSGPQGFWVDLGGAGLVDARRAATEDQPGRVLFLQLSPRRGPGYELAIHLRLANTAGNELAELGAEIED